MSRMLKALRQLESTQRLVAPKTENDDAEETVVVVEEIVAKRPAPIVPVTTPPSSDDSFEPAFTSWKELSEPYDAEQSLSFGDFLGDSDAKAQTRDVPDAVAPRVEAVATAIAEIQHEEQVALPVETPVAVEAPVEQSTTIEAAVDSPPPVDSPIDKVASNVEVEDSVIAELDLTDELTTAIVEDAVTDETVTEELIEDVNDVVAESVVEDVVNQPLVVEDTRETTDQVSSLREDVTPLQPAIVDEDPVPNAVEQEAPDESEAEVGLSNDVDESDSLIDEVASGVDVEESVIAELDLTDELATAIADDVVTEEVVTEDLIEEFAPAEESIDDGNDAVTESVVEDDFHEPLGVEATGKPTEQVSSPVEEFAASQTEIVDEAPVPIAVEQEAPDESEAEVGLSNDFDESESVGETVEPKAAMEEFITDEVAASEDTQLEDELEPSDAEQSDEPVAVVERPTVSPPPLDEPIEEDTEPIAETLDPLVSEELNWGDLFPGGELDGQPLGDELGESTGQDVDALVDSLGHFDVDDLVAQAPSKPVEEDEPIASQDDTLVEMPVPEPKAVAEEPTEVATPSDAEEISNSVDTEDRAELSPAETAALADLTDDASLKQYKALGDRLLNDLPVGEHRSAALVGAEHQPHVTETILRTAIAVGLGQTQHVLIVDASLNDKHLTAGLELSAELGLSEVIKGRVAWQQAVRATATPGVCVLPAGRLPPPKFEKDDDRLKLLLKELTSQWDLVLLDGGNCQEPSAGCVMAAARNVYLLVRLGETEAAAAAAAVAAIADCGAKNRGAIATNASPDGGNPKS